MQFAFSDGSPVAETFVFALTALLCCGLVYLSRGTRVADRAEVLIAKLASFLQKRLFTVSNPTIEERRLDLLRIVLGAIALMRNAPNLSLALQIGEMVVIVATGAATLLSLLLLIGLATPAAALFLGVLLNLLLDNYAHTSSLSSLVMSMCLIPIALAPAGRTISLDAFILRSDGKAGQIWRKGYAFIGPFSLHRATISKFLLLLAYGGISLSSGILHLQFEVWRKGFTNTWMFINPVANPNYYSVALDFYEFSPALYILATQASAYGTLVFQLAMVPLLLLSQWTKRLVILLEFGFVIGSVGLLALKWLGWNQLALCAILFWNHWKLNESGTDTILLSYDPTSAFANRLARALAVLDVFGTVELRSDLDRSAPVQAGATYKAVQTLSGKVLLLTPFWPLLWLGTLTGLGPALLAGLNGCFIAHRLANTAPTPIPSPPSQTSLQSTPFFAGITVSFAVMLLAFLARLPLQRTIPGVPGAAEFSKRVLGQSPLAFGLFQINAFNFPPMVGHQFAGDLSWHPAAGGASQSIMMVPPVRANISVPDILFYQTVVNFNMFRDNGFCYSSEFLRHLVGQPGLRSVVRRKEFADGTFSIRLSAFEVPRLTDFESWRFAPLRWHRICDAHFTAADLQRFDFSYDQAGLDAIAHRSPLPFPVAAAGAPLVADFPCVSEAQRIGFWFDRPNFSPRREGSSEPILDLLRSAASDPGPACIAKTLRALQSIDLDWRPDFRPVPGAPCEPDLSATRTLLGSLSPGDQLAQQGLQLLDEASRLSTDGDQAACLLRTGDLRRSLLARLRVAQPTISP